MNEEQNNRAACLDMDTDLFFPPPGDAVAMRMAKAVCAVCPADVREACLNVALKNPRIAGVWGGTTDLDRRKIRRLAGVTKECRRCGEEQTLLEFPKNSKTKDGHHTWCRSCWREYNASRKSAA